MSARPAVVAGGGLELVVNRGRARPRLRGWLTFTLLVVAAFLALIYSRVTLDRSAFVLQELEQQTAEAEARYWELRLEVARLEAPDRIVRAAEGLGLVYPDSRTTVTAPGLTGSFAQLEAEWPRLKAILSAQP